MISIFDMVVFVIGGVILVAWLGVFFLGKKHEAMFVTLNESEYPLKDLYFMGYYLLELTKYEYKSKSDRKLRKELSVLHEEKYTEYYVRVIYAQKVFYLFTILVLTVPLYALTDSVIILPMIPFYGGVAYYYFGTVTKGKIMKRSEELLRDFPVVVSKLALLTNAGMIVREAWVEIASTGEGILYDEMRIAVDQMQNGVSETDAIFKFGSRCIIPEIKKFASTIIQGMIKGNSELTYMLQEQSKEVWGLKKQDVRRQGEKASSKLLIPIMIMFVGIIIMIVVPIFTNMGI